MKDLTFRYKGQSPTDIYLGAKEGEGDEEKFVVENKEDRLIDIYPGMNTIDSKLVEFVKNDSQYKGLVEKGMIEVLGEHVKPKADAELTGKLEDSQKEVKELTDKLEEANGKITDLEKDDGGEAGKKIEGLEADLKKATERITELEKEDKRALKTEITKLKKTITGLNEDNKVLSGEMASLSADLDKVTA